MCADDDRIQERKDCRQIFQVAFAAQMQEQCNDYQPYRNPDQNRMRQQGCAGDAAADEFEDRDTVQHYRRAAAFCQRNDGECLAGNQIPVDTLLGIGFLTVHDF